jgi:putative transposase
MPRGSKTPLRDLRTLGRSRAVRHPDYDYVGDADVHLTLCADSGQPFARADVARLVFDNVEFYCQRLSYRLYGFTVMPDHLHVLVSPAASRIAVGVWLQRFKSYTGHEYEKLGGRPPVWQRSANDHVCRTGETAEAVLAYIVNNPVRAGLVERWQDWPWTRVYIEL